MPAGKGKLIPDDHFAGRKEKTKMKHLKEKAKNANAGRNLKVLFITGLCLALLAVVIIPVMLAAQLQAISRAESLFAGNAAFIGSSHALYGFPAPSIPARVAGQYCFSQRLSLHF